jgi:glutaminyl-peptide cyclotransferase
VLRILLFTCALLLCACGSDGSAAPAGEPVATPTATASQPADRFDGPAAFRLIRQQVAVGQRPAGSPQLRRLAVKLRDRMPDGRFEAIPGEPRLRNVVAVVPGTRPALVIGAHYDTLVEPDGFVGANNGAAGSAIVVQLARELAAAKRPRNAPELRFVLFDGEEPAQGLPEEQTNFYNAGLRGSRAYADAHGGEVGAMVLLDYVANKGLRLPREATSTPALWARLRKAARGAGADAQFPTGVGPAITDDHTPFLRAGIPAIDLIDWSYPGHSLEDGMDKLSVHSTDAVGETVRRLADAWRP